MCKGAAGLCLRIRPKSCITHPSTTHQRDRRRRRRPLSVNAPSCFIHALVGGWGESRPELGAVGHTWPGVVSPAAILQPPLLAARAPLLRSPSSCRSSLFLRISLPLLQHAKRTLLNPRLVSKHPVPPSLISPVLPVAVFVFSPQTRFFSSSSFSLLPSFLCSFPGFDFLFPPFSLILLQQNARSSRVTSVRRVHRSLCLHLILNHLFPPGACARKFINMHRRAHAGTFMC